MPIPRQTGPSPQQGTGRGTGGVQGTFGPIFAGAGFPRPTPPEQTPLPPAACDPKMSQMARMTAALQAIGWQVVGSKGIDVQQNGRRFCLSPAPAGCVRLLSGALVADLGAFNLGVWHAMNGVPGRAKLISMVELMKHLELAIHNKSLEDFATAIGKCVKGIQ